MEKSSTKTVYQTDHAGIFTGPVPAHGNPLEPGKFLIPRGAVEKEPPSIPKGKAARWDGAGWALVPDHRSEVWYDQDGHEQIILSIGDPAKLGLTPKRPVTKAMVKREASRRILTLCPQWKQIELTAQAVLMAKQLADGSKLAPEQQASWDAFEALWQQIGAIHAAAAALEAMNPIPRDFTSDQYWP